MSSSRGPQLLHTCRVSRVRALPSSLRGLAVPSGPGASVSSLTRGTPVAVPQGRCDHGQVRWALGAAGPGSCLLMRSSKEPMWVITGGTLFRKVGLSIHAWGPGGWEQGWDRDTGLSSPAPHPPLCPRIGSASLCRGGSGAETGRGSWAPGLPGGLLHTRAGCVIQEPEVTGPARPWAWWWAVPGAAAASSLPSHARAPQGPILPPDLGTRAPLSCEF